MRIAPIAAPAFALALAACAKPGTEPCDGEAGLHVHVDLSGPSHCDVFVNDAQNEESIVATLATGDPLTNFNTHQHSSTTDPPAHDFVWRWPAGTTDGWQGTISWSSQLDFQRGAAATPYTVDTGACVDVTLVPTCGPAGPDAGAP